jgi:hypothetical protein
VTGVAAPRAVGIGGLIAQRQAQENRTKALAAQAFADLGELAKHAKVLVAVAEQYVKEQADRSSKQQPVQAAGAPGGGGGGGEEEGGDFGALALNMGLVDPVTRAQAGKLFFEAVARQVSSLVRPLLERSSGMAALTDVWCAYNRARATELISPDDLMEAARLLGPLQLGMQLRVFAGGLRVIQLDSFSDAAVGRRLQHLLVRTTMPEHGQSNRLFFPYDLPYPCPFRFHIRSFVRVVHAGGGKDQEPASIPGLHRDGDGAVSVGRQLGGAVEGAVADCTSTIIGRLGVGCLLQRVIM